MLVNFASKNKKVNFAHIYKQLGIMSLKDKKNIDISNEYFLKAVSHTEKATTKEKELMNADLSIVYSKLSDLAKIKEDIPLSMEYFEKAQELVDV